MNDEPRTIRRVVVWLDPTTSQEPALEALAGLGAGAEILGLFVEDTDLVGVSQLSVAREFAYGGPATRQLERERTKAGFRVHGARMRGVFEAMVRRITPRHSFRVARGVLRTELLKISADCDTLVLAHSRRQLGARLTVRAQLAELLASGLRTLVFVQERWRTGRSIVVLFDGTPAAGTALRMAAEIARAEELDLVVWLPDARHDELMPRVLEELGTHNGYTTRRLPATDAVALARAADAEHARAIVVPGDGAGTLESITVLLDRADASLIVVR